MSLLLGPRLCEVSSLPLTGKLGLHPAQARQLLKEVVAAKMSSIKPGVLNILFSMFEFEHCLVYSPGQLLFSVKTWRKRVVKTKQTNIILAFFFE